MALEGTKFLSGDDVVFLPSVGFNVSVANVGGPCFTAIEFGDEAQHANATQGNNAAVDRVNRRLSEMTTCNKTCLVSAIMFDSADKMHCDLLE